MYSIEIWQNTKPTNFLSGQRPDLCQRSYRSHPEQHQSIPVVKGYHQEGVSTTSIAEKGSRQFQLELKSQPSYLSITIYITTPSMHRDGLVVRSLNTCSQGWGFELRSRPVAKSARRVLAKLSVIPGKMVKGITRCGHIERKDHGRIAWISLVLLNGPSALDA